MTDSAIEDVRLSINSDIAQKSSVGDVYDRRQAPCHNAFG